MTNDKCTWLAREGPDPPQQSTFFISPSLSKSPPTWAATKQQNFAASLVQSNAHMQPRLRRRQISWYAREFISRDRHQPPTSLLAVAGTIELNIQSGRSRGSQLNSSRCGRQALPPWPGPSKMAGAIRHHRRDGERKREKRAERVNEAWAAQRATVVGMCGAQDRLDRAIQQCLARRPRWASVAAVVRQKKRRNKQNQA